MCHATVLIVVGQQKSLIVQPLELFSSANISPCDIYTWWHSASAFNFLWQRATSVTAGWFAGRAWANNSTLAPKLLWHFYNVYVIYIWGRRPLITSWRATRRPRSAGWKPVAYSIFSLPFFCPVTLNVLPSPILSLRIVMYFSPVYVTDLNTVFKLVVL